MTGKAWSVFLTMAAGCAIGLLVFADRGAPQPQPPVQNAYPVPEFLQSGPDWQSEIMEPLDKSLVDHSNELGLRLFREINKSGPAAGNVAISPVSIIQALSLMANGAAGDTADQLKELLGITGNMADFNTSNGAWIKSANELRQVKLAIANSVWVPPGVSIQPQFSAVAKQYNADERVLSDDAPTATNQINAWVSDRTSGMIPHVIDDTTGINVLMANAVYFKGAWTKPFELEATIQSEFLSANGDRKICQMMTQADSFRYMKTEESQVLRLFYGYEQPVAMLIILPSPGVSVEATIESLDAKTYANFSRQLSELEKIPQGSVQIPRFKIQFMQNLNSVFNALGFGTVLQSGDFSDISADLQQGVVPEILHRSVVDVTEIGTEAAASTMLPIYAGVADVPENFEFRADRPFLFFIEQTAEGAGGLILFAGVVREMPK